MLGTINVILARLRSGFEASSRVISIAGGSDPKAENQTPKKARVAATSTLSFFEEDKLGTL